MSKKYSVALRPFSRQPHLFLLLLFSSGLKLHPPANPVLIRKRSDPDNRGLLLLHRPRAPFSEPRLPQKRDNKDHQTRPNQLIV
ncbi:hypothetical protein QC762_0070090 [Podospora pseudocomata]|uniref:Secreted protein n=1 Tax=Podospora pseudocomata TaxID=2093779 RepID=A0ABR0GGQ9_9PEZI|nr:hypothetical protein QC762_0070090 [Podospora pseudocomata]